MSDAADDPAPPGARGRGSPVRRIALSAARIAVAVVAVAVAARWTLPVPGTDVPQSAQTLAVVLVGAFLGALEGGLALAAYVLAGGLGLPVFADGAAGWDAVVGATGGYLAGFVVAAAAVGVAADRRALDRPLLALAAMVGAHALILLFGWAWLARELGPAPALAGGVTPFLGGGLVKAAVATAVVVVARKVRPSG